MITIHVNISYSNNIPLGPEHLTINVSESDTFNDIKYKISAADSKLWPEYQDITYHNKIYNDIHTVSNIGIADGDTISMWYSLKFDDTCTE
jgi:hypothetical protein